MKRLKSSSLLPSVPQTPSELAQWIREKEASQQGLKPDNEARLVWREPASPGKTPIAFVYLHGLTASPGESALQPARLANAFAGNLFVPRLPGHGLHAEDAMKGVTAQHWIDTATESLAVGRALGDRVVLIGTSLGASLAIALAAAAPEKIAAIVAWSPAVQAHDASALASVCAEGKEVLSDPRPRSDPQLKYWSASVHADGYRSLATIFRETMTDDLFRCVRAPFFMAYYYRDHDNHDQTASVPAMLSMFDRLGTAPTLKRKLAFANGAHAIGSPWRSEAAEDVYRETFSFLTDTAGLRPA